VHCASLFASPHSIPISIFDLQLPAPVGSLPPALYNQKQLSEGKALDNVAEVHCVGSTMSSHDEISLLTTEIKK
jgi:hypothetical protein